MTVLPEQKLKDLARIICRLRESLALPPDSVARDSAILRFELAFEVGCKTVQQFAREQGFEVNSPRQAFERAFSWAGSPMKSCGKR